jgi:hypothetical protein
MGPWRLPASDRDDAGTHRQSHPLAARVSVKRLRIDHERLTYYDDTFDGRLTNAHGRVVREILA